MTAAHALLKGGSACPPTPARSVTYARKFVRGRVTVFAASILIASCSEPSPSAVTPPTTAGTSSTSPGDDTVPPPPPTDDSAPSSTAPTATAEAVATAEFGPAGGSVALDGLGSVAVPAGAVADADLEIAAKRTGTPDDLYSNSADAQLTTGPRTPWEWQLTLEGTTPPVAALTLTVTYPEDLPTDGANPYFALVTTQLASEDEDVRTEFMLLGTSLDGNRRASLTIEPWAFVADPSTNKTSARVTFAPFDVTSEPSRLQRLAATPAREGCGRAPIAPPLDELNFTSPFGPRIHPKTGLPSFHDGLDLAAPEGTPVHAGGRGTVTLKDHGAKGLGNSVTLELEGGGRLQYGHLTRNNTISLPPSGAVVEAGDVIGQVGNTGTSTGPHLHLIYVPPAEGLGANSGPIRIDPLPCLDEEGRDDGTHMWIARVEISASATFTQNGTFPPDRVTPAVDYAHIAATTHIETTRAYARHNISVRDIGSSSPVVSSMAFGTNAKNFGSMYFLRVVSWDGLSCRGQGWPFTQHKVLSYVGSGSWERRPTTAQIQVRFGAESGWEVSFAPPPGAPSPQGSTPEGGNGIRYIESLTTEDCPTPGTDHSFEWCCLGGPHFFYANDGTEDFVYNGFRSLPYIEQSKLWLPAGEVQGGHIRGSVSYPVVMVTGPGMGRTGYDPQTFVVEGTVTFKWDITST